MDKRKEINILIGENLQYEREKAHLTQAKLAEMVGIEPQSVSVIERGVAGASLTTLKKICVALSISSDALLFGRLEKNDVQTLASRLEQLPPHQYEIAKEIILKLLEAFAADRK